MATTPSGTPTPPHRRWYRSLVPFAAGALAVVLVVLWINVVRSVDDGSPATTTTTTSPGTTTTSEPVTTTTAAPTTTQPDTTTTTSGDGTPPSAGYAVTGVVSGDVLNVRETPDAGAPIVATLQPDATDVVTTGPSTGNVPDPGWWEVRLDGGVTGWVNSSFLRLPADWSAPLDTMPCVADGPAYATSGSVTSPEGSIDDADHVFALDHRSGDGCDRYVVVLGAGAGAGAANPWPSTPAAAVPGGVVAAIDGPVATVTLPPGIVDSVRPTATEAALGDAFGFVVRHGAGGLEVRIHFPANRRIAVSFLDGPARIVIDARSAPTGTGLDPTPVVSERFALPRPVQIDVNGPGVAAPIAVTVYGRPFEAQGSVEVRTVGAMPGSGTPVEVGFDGDFGATTASTYAYSTTDWTEAWGIGSFTITSIPPGEYELFVGEYSPEDGSPVGVYDRFRVAP
jgi:hypothetical protein